MVPVEGVVVVGSHGLEASFDDPLIPGVDRVALSAALESIEQRVISACPSSYLHIERKRGSPPPFTSAPLPTWNQGCGRLSRPSPRDSASVKGMVLEVLPDARGGKDIALSALNPPRQLRPGPCL